VSAALDAVPGAVVTLSADLSILAANVAMGRMVTRPPSDLIGASFESLLSLPARILFQTHVFPALEADGRVEEAFLSLASSTGDIPVLLNAAKALETERAASERIAAELATALRDLAERHAEETRSRRMRDAFAGVVSHELRTPITTIFGLSHLLRQRYRTLDPEAVEQQLGDIEAESDRLRRLTEDLLVLSRAEGGRLDVAQDPINLRHVIDLAVESERRRAPDRHFLVEIASHLPPVLGEETHVEQVLRNYLSNAVKYSPARTTITIRAETSGDGVGVRVVDEGAGLPAGPSDRLFDLFYRAADAVHQASGAGIGLFVCRELVQAMGGRVWAHRLPGGSEFGFVLPAAEVDPDVP